MSHPKFPDPNSFEQVQGEDHQHVHRPPTNEELIEQIHETADKLIRDQTARGDVKLLNTALKELRYSFKIFSAYRKHRKVTVFGSARLTSTHPAYAQAVEFSRRLADAGYMVITGAASGIMEAGHVGAGRDRSIGINILLPFEQQANPIIRGDMKLMHLRYFFTRKLLFVKEADAIALFPGGFGTLDEGFEVLTLVQTGKSHLMPIVLIDEPGGDYWKRVDWFIREVLLARHLIAPADLHLYKITDSVDDAVAEVLNFYRVYHSMRYVKQNLVLRLTKPLPESKLRDIQAGYTDILVSGTFEQIQALPEEANDAQALGLPRLRFHFDRHNLGRLRQLVNFINAE